MESGKSILQKYKCLISNSERVEIVEEEGEVKFTLNTKKKLEEFEKENKSKWCSFCLSKNIGKTLCERIGHHLYQKAPGAGKCPICGENVHFFAMCAEK